MAVLLVGAMFSVVSASGAISTISGVVSDFQIIPSQSAFGAPNLTVVTFEDGRVITFEGILAGVVVQKGRCNLFRYHNKNLLGAASCSDTSPINP
jgi:hypothetical protein